MQNGSLLDPSGTYPKEQPMTLAALDEASYYYRNGLPILQRYLPFRIASLADRYIILLIPLLVVMFPLFKAVGPVYRWRVRARIYRWYKHLREIDRKLQHGTALPAWTRKYAGWKPWRHSWTGSTYRSPTPTSCTTCTCTCATSSSASRPCAPSARPTHRACGTERKRAGLPRPATPDSTTYANCNQRHSAAQRGVSGPKARRRTRPRRRRR